MTRKFAVAAAAAFFATVSLAQEYKLGSIVIEHPWSRATPTGASVGAGYMTIKNNGSIADRLVGGSVAFARRLEVHSMTMDGGVMKMRQVKDGLEIKPGETVEFKPGAYHLMFADLKQPLAPGQHVKVTLSFENAGTIDVDYAVETMGAGAQGAHGGHGMKGH